MSPTVSPNDKGPQSYENWKCAEEGNAFNITYEYPFYCDARIVGEFTEDCGPYRLFNTIASPLSTRLAPRLILRMDDHRNGVVLPDDWKTDVNRYHGGGAQDEIAALVSLCLGVRTRAGAANRIFTPNGDPKGQPIIFEFTEKESVLLKPEISSRLILPRAVGEHSLEAISILRSLPTLSPSDARALIKSARVYQDALWVSESDPEISWLLLVSAVEIMAERWSETSASPVERLKLSHPRLVTLLGENGGEQLIGGVADLLVQYLGATRKFIDFLLHFLPDPPQNRPPENCQHPWEKQAMESSFKVIYKWRSKALHSGIPFPFPMCSSPYRHEDTFYEIPIGLGTSALDAIWTAEDTPMLLHLFEYIVRNSIQKWWMSRVSDC